MKLLFLVLLLMSLVSCSRESDIASRNLSVSADNFEINRRIIFYNGITNDYILVIEGLCALGNFDAAKELSVTCKVGPKDYKKHFLGLSDNVTFFSEQIESSKVNPHFYKVTLKPSSIIPDIEVR